MIIIYIVALFVILVIGAFAVLRLPALLVALLWLVVPAALTPIWLEYAQEWHWSWFGWAKVWSVVAGCALLSAFAGSSKSSSLPVSIAIWILLAVNILEASAANAGQGFWLNALAGSVLIVAALPSILSAQVAEGTKLHVVAYDLPWLWVLGFTLWDLCFVYLHSGGLFFGQHVAVLAAPIALATLSNRRFWLHARAVTLGLHLIIFNTFYSSLRQQFNTSSWHHPTVMTWFQIASLCLAIATCAQAFWRWRARDGEHGSRRAGAGCTPAPARVVDERVNIGNGLAP